jgi:hypothetical protein
MKKLGGCSEMGLLKHGFAQRTKKPPEYLVWVQMKRRCKLRRTYIEKGVKVCERWLSFENFLNDMGPRPGPEFCIERINNNGSYSPKNCRWATQHEQRRNQSGNRLRWLVFKGERLCAKDWAKRCGMKYMRLISRLNRGWSIKRALTTEVRA